MSAFPLLIKHDMMARGCKFSAAESVYQAMLQRPIEESEIFWLRARGYTYGEIGEILKVNKGTIWRVINHKIKDSVYSIILGYSA